MLVYYRSPMFVCLESCHTGPCMYNSVYNVEKLEVTECRSGAFCLTLIIAHHAVWYCEVCTGFQYSSKSVSRLPSLWWTYIHGIACRYRNLQELCVPVENVGGHSGHSLLSASAECIQQPAMQTSSTGQPQTAECHILLAYSMEWPAICVVQLITDEVQTKLKKTAFQTRQTPSGASAILMLFTSVLSL